MLHVVAGTATLLGAALLAVGTGISSAWLAWLGGGLIGVGAAAYVGDTAMVLRGATVTYRPPQCFIAAALFWLIVALALGAGTLAGKLWQSAFGFVMLAGWAGQMVNGHILHIGVRLIATIYRGDDDETPPGVLLGARRPWVAFAATQLGVGALACGLVLASSALAATGAALGVAGWLASLAALVKARAAANLLTV